MPAIPTRSGDGISSWIFQDTTAAPKTGLVVVYDLEDFTSFLMLPDIQHAATRYLNYVDQQVRLIYEGGTPLYLDGSEAPEEPLLYPAHRKFLGDGAMFIFDVTTLAQDVRTYVLGAICNRARNIKASFSLINAAALEFMPVSDVPKRIRFGITYGTIYEMTRSDGRREYIGFPINLAARLQKYAGAASLLASARVNLPHSWFVENDFKKVLPLKLRNGATEYVYIDGADLIAAEEGLFAEVYDPAGKILRQE
jgi:class 3 adenylate cyclase